MLWHGKSFYQRRSSKAFGNEDCLADLEWRSEERQSKLRHYGLRQISAPPRGHPVLYDGRHDTHGADVVSVSSSS
jgi:hypothetical protein